MSNPLAYPLHRTSVVPLLVLVASGLLTFGVLVAMGYPYGWLVWGVLAAIPAAFFAVRNPQLVVAFVAFLLFTNAPVVAFKFHGLPRVAALVGPPAALGTLLAYQLFVRRKPLVFPRAWWWAMALLAVEVVSAMMARYPGLAIGILKEHLIEGLGLFLIFANLIRDRQCLRQVVLALLLAGSLMGGLSLVQQLTHTHRNDYGGFAQVPFEGKGFATGEHHRQRRSAGPLGEQNRYAQNMLMLVPLAVLPIGGVVGPWRKLGYVLAAVLISAGCMLTFSRGAAVAFGILILLMRFTGYIRTRHLGMLAVASLLLLLAFPQIASRMDSLGTLVGYLRGDTGAQTQKLDGAITGRATSMLAALRVTADYPILGVGPGNFPLYNREYAKVGGFRAHDEDRAAHCLYLHLSAEYGLLGLTLFLGMIAVTLRDLHRVWRRYRDEDPQLATLAAGVAMALLAYLVTGLFLHFSFIRFFWIIMAIACSIPLIAAREQALREDRSAPTGPGQGTRATANDSAAIDSAAIEPGGTA
ncbi:O-antigen ligase family protein [Roseimaritima sediminicola]|uniref:O-antigen ligase family protein n=1 Tax=Roseimaritima sediminicola TaxID=2662066 RepID=UPI001298376C|nr:O-antigen ligase family protein [Roseimaritima sediminicola]